MTWESPTCVEVNMHAEINAYHDDRGDVPDVHARSTAAPIATNSQ